MMQITPALKSRADLHGKTVTFSRPDGCEGAGTIIQAMQAVYPFQATGAPGVISLVLIVRNASGRLVTLRTGHLGPDAFTFTVLGDSFLI
jgi:hypothetical protein